MMTQEQLQAEIDRLRQENEDLKRKPEHKVTIKANVTPTIKDGVTLPPKGSVSLYGLGRFPVSLYPDQWDKVFALTDQIKAACDSARDVAAAHKASK